MSNLKSFFLMLALSVASCCASARTLPAFSPGCGPLDEPGDPGTLCLDRSDPVKLDRTDPDPVESSWRLHGPAVSHHFSQRGAPAGGYQQNNLGVGIEYDRRDSATVERYYAGLVRDSYDRPSIYAGGAYQWTIVDQERLRIDAGAITMLWNRSVVGSDDIARKQTILAALPMVSIEDKKTGLGLNVSFIPKISYRGRQYTVNTLTFQLSVEL